MAFLGNRFDGGLSSLFVLVSAFIGLGTCWDYSATSPTGINSWGTFFPQCLVAQQSPITFYSSETRADATHTDLVRIQNASGVTVNALIYSGDGGLITAKFNRPVYFRFRNQNYIIQSIVFHSTTEHNSVSPKASGELQILCALSATGATSLVLAVQFAPTSDSAAALQVSVVASLMNVIANQTSLLAAKGEVSAKIPFDAPLFNFPGDTLAMTYSGSISFPPCNRFVTVVVFSSALQFPATLTSSIRKTTNGVVTVRPRQQRDAATQAFRLNVTELPTADEKLMPLSTPHPVQYINDLVPTPVSNPQNLSMEIAIICLTVFCVVLVLVILVLLLARYEYVDLPTWLGGISRRVEWWENPKSARTVVNSDEDGEDEEGGEEEEDEEGDEEEEGEEVEMAPRN